MKYLSKILVLALALALMATMATTALAEYGSAAVANGQTYTTEQMLTYAIQDEYMALAEYQAIIAKFGTFRPFTSMVEAEQRHIDLLKPLFEQYGVTLPENNAAGMVTAPETLAMAYEAGQKAETSNIAMYDTFLSQSIPADVQAVFASLKAASENHLATVERKISGQSGNMSGNGAGQGNGNGSGNRRANGRGGNRSGCGAGYNSKANGVCGNCTDCPNNTAA